MDTAVIRVLLVDDDQDYFVLIGDSLSDIRSQRYDLKWVFSYTDALQEMATGQYDICLLDFNLGEYTGLDIMRAFQEQNYDVPIIMLTSQSDLEVDLETMRAGAADYLPKRQADSASLERSIRYSIERQRTLKALRESESRIADLYQQEREKSQELELANTNLRRVERLRDDLTRMIIHDLRNPLTIISTTMDMLAQAKDNPVITENIPTFLQGARSAGKRMTGMIDDLLHLSKLEIGQLRLSLTLVSPADLLNKKMEAYHLQAEKEEKVLSLQIQGEIPAIFLDLELISRVLDNLIGNAFKYTQAGGLIEVGVEPYQNHFLRFHVQDDGEGIPQEYHHRIFDKFVQVTDANGAPLRKGTGLGLAFCRLTVEAHGGQIWVESSPNMGSIFYFCLPITGEQ